MWHDTILYDLTWYDPNGAVSPALPRYEGNWVNDKKHGHGEEHYNDGGRFSGSHSLAMSSKISMTIAWHCIPLHFCFSGRLVLRLVLWYGFQMVSRIKAWTTNRSSFVSVLFHKVVGICLPWNSLTLTFMKVLFSLKCYILGCLDSGTDSDRDLAVFSVCFHISINASTRYAPITLILERLSPRLKLPELEHHFWPLPGMQTRLHSLK